MAFVEASARKAEHEVSDRAGRKSGVFTGSYAINPANGAKLPLWVVSYVLMGYGKGAIMAVPGHDSRDHAFARVFDLPIVRVVTGGGDTHDEAWEGDGTIVNSPPFDDAVVGSCKTAAIAWLEARGAAWVTRLPLRPAGVTPEVVANVSRHRGVFGKLALPRSIQTCEHEARGRFAPVMSCDTAKRSSPDTEIRRYQCAHQTLDGPSAEAIGASLSSSLGEPVNRK